MRSAINEKVKVKVIMEEVGKGYYEVVEKMDCLKSEMKKLKEMKEQYTESLMDIMGKNEVVSVTLKDQGVIVMLKEMKQKGAMNKEYIMNTLEEVYDKISLPKDPKEKAERTTDIIMSSRQETTKSVIKLKKLRS